MNLPREAPDFATLVSAEIDAVKAFVTLLNEEAGVLRGNDVGALEGMTAAKEKLAGELESIGKKRETFFSAAGLEPNATAMERWLATQPSRSAELWRELMHLAQTAKELNLANGQCIALLARNTRAQLSALTGQADDEEGIYTSKGHTASPFSSSAPSPADTGFRIRDKV